MRLCLLIAAGCMLAPVVALADALEGKATVAEVTEAAQVDDWRVLDQNDLLYITLERGTVIVALSPSLAQNHVAQMRALAREEFYDGLSFYRVIEGFVAQGGDVLEQREVTTAAASLAEEFDDPLTDDIVFSPLPDADGYASSVGFVDSLPAGRDGERVWLLHCTGAMAMARDVARDTGGTEFYVTLQPQRYLDRNLSVFGRVVDGMEHLQGLRRVAPAQSADDDLGETIVSMRVGVDLPPEQRKSLRIMRADTPWFADYVEARRNRASAFFYHRPDYVDICQLPVLVGPAGEAE